MEVIRGNWEQHAPPGFLRLGEQGCVVMQYIALSLKGYCLQYSALCNVFNAETTCKNGHVLYSKEDVRCALENSVCFSLSGTVVALTTVANIHGANGN